LVAIQARHGSVVVEEVLRLKVIEQKTQRHLRIDEIGSINGEEIFVGPIDTSDIALAPNDDSRTVYEWYVVIADNTT
jgi:hypothetical protein